jgi:hypothetical protein
LTCLFAPNYWPDFHDLNCGTRRSPKSGCDPIYVNFICVESEDALSAFARDPMFCGVLWLIDLEFVFISFRMDPCEFG